MTMIKKLFWLRLPVTLLGLLLYFFAERYATDHSISLALNATAILLILGTIIMTLVRAMLSKREGNIQEAHQFQLMTTWKLLLLASIVAYHVYQKLLLSSGGTLESPQTKIALGIWLILLVVSLFAMIGLELGHQRAGSGKNTDNQRVIRSLVAWTNIGLLLCSLAGINYFGATLDKSIDLTYLKVTQPSVGTLTMLSSMDAELTVSIFYPDTNEVKPLVADYFRLIAASEPRVKLRYIDKELEPELAKELKISQNGSIAIKYKERTERIKIGTELSKSQKNLKKLDALFQKSLSSLVTKEKVVYFTEGHGEMRGPNEQDFRRKTSGLDQILRSQNFKIQKIDAKSGLLSKIPDDAAVVAIVGPTRPFLSEEIAVIRQYLQKGGSLFVAIDDTDTDEQSLLGATSQQLQSLLAEAGLKVTHTNLAHEKRYVSLTKTNADRWFLYSNIFGSHLATETMSKLDREMQILFWGTGFIEVSSPEGWKTAELIKSYNDTFADLNKNFSFDPSEKKATYTLAAASEKKADSGTSRVYLAADAHIFSDFLLNNVGNQVMILDTFKWLSQDLSMATTQNSEEDIKIVHSKDKHLYIFYGSVLFVPSLVLIAGFFATRKRVRRT